MADFNSPDNWNEPARFAVVELQAELPSVDYDKPTVNFSASGNWDITWELRCPGDGGGGGGNGVVPRPDSGMIYPRR